MWDDLEYFLQILWRIEAANERSGYDATASAELDVVELGPNRRPMRQVMIGGISEAIFIR